MKLSTSSLWVMDGELKGSESSEYRNSWWFSPVVWDVLLDKYMHEEIKTPYGTKRSLVSLDGVALSGELNDKVNACDSVQDRICWEISNQQVFFTKDKALIAQAIKGFCSDNTEYHIHSEDEVSVLTFDHIIERFNEISNDILSIDEKEHPYFVFKNTSVDDGVECWFEHYDEETEEYSQRSLKELDKYVTEFVRIDDGRITGFTSNLDFGKSKEGAE